MTGIAVYEKEQEKALTPDVITGVVGGVMAGDWRHLGSLPTDKVQT